MTNFRIQEAQVQLKSHSGTLRSIQSLFYRLHGTTEDPLSSEDSKLSEERFLLRDCHHAAKVETRCHHSRKCDISPSNPRNFRES